MKFLLFLLSFSAMAATSEVRNLYDKTFARDNAFCRNTKQRIEILIRGDAKNIEPKDFGFGEYLFYRDSRRKLSLLDINKSRSDSYKLFLGTSPYCSKIHGYMIDDKTLAVLLLKENRPFKEKLVIQLFDFQSLTPKEVLETSYVSERAKKFDGGFAFNSLGERFETDIGKVTIEETPFTYQDRDFPQWVSYTGRGFETLATMTYQKFPWKKAFKDEQDFLALSGWDESEKIFKNKYLYIAVNHKLKKGCIIFLNEKKKITGSEPWRCQAI